MDIATIGHSTHSIEHFLSLLTHNGISAIADVRSTPYSRHNPQFSREALKASLKGAGIAYVFLGKELGARSDDPRHYESGRVLYKRVAESELFRAGIERVANGTVQHRVALMCAERDPLTCHRTILVARALVERGATVRHVLGDGSVETHEAALDRLMAQLGIDARDLFTAPELLRARAYADQEAKIAYTLPQSEAAA